jgi:linear primary-alkylsulfatase
VVESVVNTGTVVGEMINSRSSYMYGNWIGVNRINDGIGPEVLEGKASFQMPSRTFTDELLFSAAGINMKLVYVPSETDDEIVAFLPDGMNLTYPSRQVPASAPDEDGWGGPGMLLSAEVIQGPSFPNLYSLRGTSYRNPAQWFRSVDKLREFDSWSMVPATACRSATRNPSASCCATSATPSSSLTTRPCGGSTRGIPSRSWRPRSTCPNI